MDIFNSTLYVKDRVSDELKQQLTKVQQYTRRPNVTILGIEKEKGEKFGDLKGKIEKLVTNVSPSLSMDDIDKFHRDGPADGGDQAVIVRFKTHTDKENFYKEGRAKLKELNDHRIKIRPNLCRERKNLLDSAVAFVDTYPKDTFNPPDFVFADVHGNIKVKMKERPKRGMIFEITSLNRLGWIIQTAQELEHQNQNLDNDFVRYDEDYTSGAYWRNDAKHIYENL